MAKKKQTNNVADLREEVGRLKAENQRLRRFGHFNNLTKLGGEAIRTGRAIGPWFCAWLISRQIAGKVTVATAALTVESHTLGEAVTKAAEKAFGIETLLLSLCTLAIGGLVYGRRQAELRRNDVERLSWYKTEYEKLFDRMRSSSKITRRGDTRPEDQ